MSTKIPACNVAQASACAIFSDRHHKIKTHVKSTQTEVRAKLAPLKFWRAEHKPGNHRRVHFLYLVIQAGLQNLRIG